MEEFELEDLIIDLIDNEEFDSALEHLNDYLCDFGTNEFYYFSLSDIFLAKKDFSSTIDLMDAAFEDGIDNDLLYERYGDAYYGLGDYHLSLEWYLKCNLQEDNPNLLHTIYMIGLCYFLLEDYSNAINYFEDVLLEMPSQEAFYNCAVSYLYVNKIQRACEYFDKVFSNDLLSKPICIELISHGCLEEGKSFFDRLNEPDDYLYYLWCSDFYESVSSYDLALNCLYKALDLHPSDSLKCDIASLHKLNGDVSLCEKLCKEVLENDVNLNDSQLEFVVTKLHAMSHLNDYSEQYVYLERFENFAETDFSIYISLLSYSLDNKLLDYQDHLLYECNFCLPSSLDEQNSLNDLHVLIHLNHERYQVALDLLDTMSYRTDIFYYRNLVICYYNLQQYEKVVLYYDYVMPDGKFAIMMLDSFIKIEDEAGFDRVLEDMEDIHVDNVQDFYEVLSSILPSE